MRLLITLYIGILLPSLPLIGQPVIVNTLKISGISRVSVDQLGNFYFVCDHHTIQQRNRNGKLLHEAPIPMHHLSLMECWSPLSLFFYSTKEQRYTLLDHTLDTLESRSLPPILEAVPKLVCPENNLNKLWMFDSTDLSLKKINLLSSTIEVDTPIPKKWITEESQIIFMRAYQNRVFLLDKERGIFIFSAIGVPVTHIKVSGLIFFNFVGEELCYVTGNKVVLTNLYTQEQRTLKNHLDNVDHIEFALVTDERLVVITPQKIYFTKVVL